MDGLHVIHEREGYRDLRTCSAKMVGEVLEQNFHLYLQLKIEETLGSEIDNWLHQEM